MVSPARNGPFAFGASIFPCVSGIELLFLGIVVKGGPKPS